MRIDTLCRYRSEVFIPQRRGAVALCHDCARRLRESNDLNPYLLVPNGFVYCDDCDRRIKEME